MHGTLLQLALVVAALVLILFGSMVMHEGHLLHLGLVLMARELRLLDLIVRLMLRRSPILVKLVNVLI